MNAPDSRIRVAIVDDHAMVRQALADVLGNDPGLEIVAQGSSTLEAARIVREQESDVLVLDYNMPGGGALTVVEEIRRTSSPIRVLVLTLHESAHYAVKAIEAGAHGFLVKSSAVEELLEAIRVIRRGEVYITPSLSMEVIDLLRRPRDDREGLAALSSREFELLRILAAGAGIKEAARQLKIGVSTASTYRARLLKKLRLESTSDLIRFALENDIAG